MQANSRSFTERQDDAVQGAVLSFILDEHPTLIGLGDLALEFDAGDDLDRAVRDLIGVGLLRREGASILATRAALCFERLGER